MQLAHFESKILNFNVISKLKKTYVGKIGKKFEKQKCIKPK